MDEKTFLEARLPLTGGDISRFGSNYGAFVITMHPSDFLSLTTDKADLERIKADAFPIPDEEFAKQGYTPGKFQLPYLDVEYPTGRVMGHEGRHRAAMIMKQGGDVFPVAIFMKDVMEFELRYTVSDYEDYGPEETKIEWFDNMEAARKRKQELVDFDYGEDSSLFNSNIKIEIYRGGKLRGCPERSDPSTWTYAPWEISDFPRFLIGQFYNRVSIPSSRFKVGLMKGGLHHPIRSKR